MSADPSAEGACSGYRHEALMYAGREQFMAGTLPFIRAALAADAPILVVLAEAKNQALRGALGEDAGRVLFADMAHVGANPGRIIPAWQDFITAHGEDARRLRGIGEPIWPERSDAELAECQRHEELLNVAFPDPDFTLLCPYDTDALSAAVIEAARRSHPFLTDNGGASAPSASYAGASALVGHEGGPLAEPPADTPQLAFGEGELARARAWVTARARGLGLAAGRLPDLLLAVNEIATNSLLHGGGGGILRVWREHEAVVCEVRDAGTIADPLAGRRRPGAEDLGGRGLWIANQIADLVQLRTTPAGTVVRIHARL